MPSSSSGFLPLGGVFEPVVTRLVDLVVLAFLLAGMAGVVFLIGSSGSGSLLYVLRYIRFTSSATVSSPSPDNTIVLPERDSCDLVEANRA